MQSDISPGWYLDYSKIDYPKIYKIRTKDISRIENEAQNEKEVEACKAENEENPQGFLQEGSKQLTDIYSSKTNLGYET